MRDFRKLRVFDRAHEAVLEIHRVTDDFPRRETYGLGAQMRRAATSIGSNICEACGKPSDAEFRRYLSMSFGSCSEVKYQILLSRDLGYITPDRHQRLEQAIDEVMRMLSGLMKTADSRLPVRQSKLYGADRGQRSDS